MAVEEVLGRPVGGHPLERIAALERRLQVLREEKSAVLDLLAEGDPDAESLLDAVNKDIERARQLLADWRAQVGASS